LFHLEGKTTTEIKSRMLFLEIHFHFSP